MCNHKWMGFGVDANGNYRICSKCGKKVYIITNADRIRSMSDEELAKNNVHLSYQCDIDYNWEEEPYENWMQCYETSDGSTFLVEKDAIEYELNWLREPAEGEQYG